MVPLLWTFEQLACYVRLHHIMTVEDLKAVEAARHRMGLHNSWLCRCLQRSNSQPGAVGCDKELCS